MIHFQYKELDKKEHPLRVLYPSWHYVVSKLSLYAYLEQMTRVKEELYVLELSKSREMVILAFWYKKISYIFVVLMAAILLYVVSLSSEKISILHENKIERDPSYIGKEVTVNARLKGEEELEFSDIAVKIEEEEYTEEEFFEKVDQLEGDLLTQVLLKNQSVQEVQSSLALPDELFSTGIQIEWRTDGVYVTSDGEILNDEISRPVDSILTAIFSYKGFEQKKEFAICILPRVYTKEEALYLEYQKELEAAVKKSKTETVITLPDKVEDFMISYEMEYSSTAGRFLVFGVLVGIALWFGMDRDVLDKNRKRKEQLLYDYPEMIQKLTLLLSAGMTVRGAFLKIADQKQSRKSKKRFLHEEINFTLNEIMTGVSEVVAYEHMGRRIGLVPYLRLGTYLSQNLRKGSRGLIEQLSKEAMEAFEDRKDMAKQLGEKAGTKLLMPMIVMLAIVLFITMYPAFSSMSG